MVFSSITFLVGFLPLVLLALKVLPQRFHNGVLLFFSLIFYAWGEPVYILLMLTAILWSYASAKCIARAETPRQKKWRLIASLTLQVGLLAFFKYADMLIGGLHLVGCKDVPYLHLPLPLGISFYLFQTMSYTIDVYREKVQPAASLLPYATYVSLFPQLVAGPIVRYETVAEELRSRVVTAEDTVGGAERFLWGLAKKVLLANAFGEIQQNILAGGVASLPMITAWLALWAFTLQIYFDFSGYSDMAIGMGRMFGFHFLENFNYPYTAYSVRDFWKRWHMSLSSWFQEYVYIPLGGNRCTPSRNAFNLLLTWFLTGLWHGAHVNFILWGLYYGVLLLIERRRPPRQERFLSHQVGTFLLVCLGWAIFMMTDLRELGVFFKALFHLNDMGYLDAVGRFYTRHYLPLWLMGIVASRPEPMAGLLRLREKKGGEILYQVLLIVLFFFALAALVWDQYNPFLYFRF